MSKEKKFDFVNIKGKSRINFKLSHKRSHLESDTLLLFENFNIQWNPFIETHDKLDLRQSQLI